MEKVYRVVQHEIHFQGTCGALTLTFKLNLIKVKKIDTLAFLTQVYNATKKRKMSICTIEL